MSEGYLLTTFFILYKYVLHSNVISSFLDQSLKLFISKSFLLLRRSFRIFYDQSKITIHFTADNSNLKLHQVHRQCTSLIRKHILYLSQFFIQWCWSDITIFFPKITEHQSIFFYEVALRHLHNLNRNNQRYRNHCIDQYNISTEYQYRIKSYTIRRINEIGMIFLFFHQKHII